MRMSVVSLVRLVNDRKVRGYIAQALVLGAVAAILWFFVANAIDNLRRGGIASGFAFMDTVSGVEVPFRLIDYGAGGTYARLLLVGVLNTLLVSALGIVAATVLGFLIGIARLSNNWLLSRLSEAYIEFVRNIPLLLFVFFWYFGIIASLPGPKESFSVFDAAFLNKRGLYIPAPEAWLAFLVDAARRRHWRRLCPGFWRDGPRRGRRRPAEAFPCFRAGVTLLAGLPLGGGDRGLPLDRLGLPGPARLQLSRRSDAHS